MKKILIFSTAYLPFIGGAEIAVKEITDRLSPEVQGGEPGNFYFDLITARLDKNLPREEKVGRVDVYRIGWGSKLDKFILPIFGLIKARSLNRKNNYVLAWAIMASQAGIAAAFFKIFTPGKKMLLTLQEGDEEEHLKRYAFGSTILYKIFVQPLHQLVIKKADCITAISKHLKERAIKAGSRVRAEVVPNGVDWNKFSPSDDKGNLQFSDNDFKSKLGLRDEKVIITVSRLVKKNGVEDLIRAMKMLKDESGELKFILLIVGTGELEGKLKALAKELGLYNVIKFLGRIPNEEIPKYLWISDVFVRASLSEGLGNVFLEAMAAEAPVIATPVGGITDFLVNGENGLFCEVNNPASIKEKIKMLLDNGALREKLVLGGKRTVAEKYNWDNIAQKMDQIFKGLIK